MLRTRRAGKGSGGCGGGAYAQGTQGAQACPPPLVSEGRGPHLGAQQASWARVGGAVPLHSSATPPGWLLPPSTPDLPGLLPMPPGPTWPGWGFAEGICLGAQQAPRPQWARRSPSAPLLFFQESPSRLPLLITLASGAPILSGLHFSSMLSPPTSYRFTLGFLPSPWVSESLTSDQQAP